MNAMLSIGLLAIGIILIFLGINAAGSFGSDVTNFFTGRLTDNAVWMLFMGIVITLAGMGGTVFLPKV